MSDGAHDLDRFEEALLHRLRAQVEQHAAPEAPGLAAAPARPGRPWYASVAAVAAAVLVLAVLLHVARPEPAFAVTGRNGSTIKIKVARLEGADRLEQALRDHGVASDITYLAPGKACAPGRYAERPTHDLRLGVSADRFWVTIPPGAVGPGDTFVLSASVVPLPNGVQASVEFGIATGAVAPCRVVDAP